MRWTPHSTVAVVVEQNGRFLLIEERSSGRIVLNQPAGHIEQGETFIEAAVREAREESGWEVEPKSLIGFYVHPSINNDITYHRMCFHAAAVQHYPDQPLDDGIITTHWLTLGEIEQQAARLRTPVVLQCIYDYLAGRSLPLDFIVEEV
ncbi:NUDIX hydrolase [Marinobacterium jannaschii]|uniref:NUDIX hydrolase n=1 Tax=Marinobacterium jannaschii TaxID=64970 RepID=UPI000483248C|nr:NUDIX hydrolase [Marinobacterium jannaschii]